MSKSKDPTIPKTFLSGSSPVDNAKKNIDSRKREAVFKDYELFLDNYVRQLEGLKNADFIADYDKRRIGELIDFSKGSVGNLKNSGNNFSANDLNTVKHLLIKSAEGLKSKFKSKNNVLRTIKAVRRSAESPSLYEEENVGVIDQKYLDYVRSKKSLDAYSHGFHHSNVMGSPKGRVTSEMVDAIKNFDGDPFYNSPAYTEKKSAKYAVRSSVMDVDREIENIKKLLSNGRTLSYEESKVFDTTDSNSSAGAFFESKIKSLRNVIAREARALSGDSKVNDLGKYHEFLKNKNKTLENLVRQLGVGGIASDIMNMIERQISQDGYLDSYTFNNILSMLSEQREKDDEGLSEDIINDLNELNKKVVEAAEKYVENEDSMAVIRLFQVVLIASVFVGFPLIGPIVSEFAATLFGQGLAHGAPALMTANFLGPIGDVAAALFLDQFATIILTQTPLVAELIGVVDYALLSGPGLIFGESMTALLASPLVPIAAATGFMFYAHSYEDYNKVRDDGNKSFKGFNKELSNIAQRYTSGKKADMHKNAGGALNDENIRNEFCEKKYEFVKGSNKIAAMVKALRFVDDLSRMGYEERRIYDSIWQNFSEELREDLRNNGLMEEGRVSDWYRLKEGVAKLIYDADSDPIRKKLVDELNEKFGLFLLACETSVSNEKEDIAQRFANYMKDGNEKNREMNAKIGDAVFSAKYDLARGEAVGVESDTNLLKDGFAGKSQEEMKDLARKISSEAQRVKKVTIEKESEFIKNAIAKRAIDTDLMEAHNRDVAKVSEYPKNSPSNPDADKLGSALGKAGLVEV